MLSIKNPATVALFAAMTLVVSAPTFSLDSEESSPAVLHAEALTYAVVQPVGKAAGQVDMKRQAQRDAPAAKLNANEKLWQAVTQGTNVNR